MVPINQRNGDVYPRIELASRDIARQRTEVTALHVRIAGSAATSELLGKKVFGELARVKEPTPHHPGKDEAILQLGGKYPQDRNSHPFDGNRRDEMGPLTPLWIVVGVKRNDVAAPPAKLG